MIDIPPGARLFRPLPRGGTLEPAGHGLALGWAWDDGRVFIRVWGRRSGPGGDGFEDLWFGSIDECLAALGGHSDVHWTDEPWPVHAHTKRPFRRLI